MAATQSLQSLIEHLDNASRLSCSGVARRATPAAAALSAPASGKDPTMSDLMAALNAATGGTAAEVDKGLAPLPQNVGIMPATEEKEALQAYGYLQEMSSLAALYVSIFAANLRTGRGHPKPYDITVASEASQAFADMANASYQVMTGPLAGFYSLASATQSTFSKRMSKTELHLGFLGELFKDFNLTDVANKQLDSILTKFMSSLNNITVGTQTERNTVDQTLRINQPLRINVSGSDESPLWVYQPRTRLVYLKIEASSFKWASNKVDHSNSSFNMTYSVIDGDLNVNKYLAAKPKLDEIFTTLTTMNLAEYGKKISPAPVQQKPV